MRCAWAENDPLMRAYHDEEWGVPRSTAATLWEMLMLEGFQAGLAWIVVLRKREAFRKAFRGFDPQQGGAASARRISSACWRILASSAREPRSRRRSPGRRTYLDNGAARVRIFQRGFGRWPGGSRSRTRGTSAGEHTAVGEVLQGTEEARVQICGSGDCLRVDAGGGDCERSRGGLFSAGILRADQAQTPLPASTRILP